MIVDQNDIAARLKVSPRTIYSLRERGGMPFLQIGRSIRYDTEAVDQWVRTKCARNGLDQQS